MGVGRAVSPRPTCDQTIATSLKVSIMSRPRSPSSGFTLIELMIAVAIVAILAAIALPSYNTYVTRSKLPAAFSQLAGYGVALQQWYQDNRTYTTYTDATGLDCNAGTTVTPTNSNFSYSCTSNNATSYTLTATGVGASSVAGFTFTLDQAGNQATPNVPSGWTSSTTCWVRDTSGACK
jgi:type IV pilus assembly protein PilE